MDTRKITGYTLGFVAAATYGLNPLFALPLMADGMDTSSILFFRYLLAIPIVALMMAIRGKSAAVTAPQCGLLAIFGILVGLSSLTLFESYRYMEAGIASTLLFVYPLMVAIIMAALFHEKITSLTIFCLATALTGIGLLYQGEGGVTLSATGTALVMGSALSYALYIVGVNRTRLSKVPTLTVILCARFRSDNIQSQFIGKRKHMCAARILPVVRCQRTRLVADRSLIPMHNHGHRLYRLNPDGHTRRHGAGDGRNNRSDSLRRTADLQKRRRVAADSHSRDAGNRRGQHRPPADSNPPLIPTPQTPLNYVYTPHIWLSLRYSRSAKLKSIWLCSRLIRIFVESINNQSHGLMLLSGCVLKKYMYYIMKKILAVAVGIVVSASGVLASNAGKRIAALDNALWACSEWISAADAPVVEGRIDDFTRGRWCELVCGRR